MFIDAVLLDVHTKTDRMFEYRVNEAYQGKVCAGMRVLVPFGKMRGAKTALVMEVREQSAFGEQQVKDIAGVLDDEPVATEVMLKMIVYLRETFFCTYAEAALCVLPSVRRVKKTRYYRLCEAKAQPAQQTLFGGHSAQKQGAKTKNEALALAIMDILTDGEAHSEEALRRRAGKTLGCSPALEEVRRVLGMLLEKGVVVRGEKSRVCGKESVLMAALCEDEAKVEEKIRTLLKRSSAQKKAVQYLLSNPQSSFKALRAQGISAQVLKALVEKGIVRKYTVDKALLEEDAEMQGGGAVCMPDAEKPVLTKMQKEVIDLFWQKRAQGVRTFLLRGVTGSGKTEVYLRLFERVIKEGGQCLFLVPEISLTPQMTQIVKERFGQCVAVMHSRLGEREKEENYNRVKSGQARIVLGARSALFMPFSRLGLIVVDEEHETSYRSSSAPRYDALHVAGYLAEEMQAVLLLASATPDVCDYYRAVTGEMCLLEMKQRVEGRKLPVVEVVDMKRELMEGNRLPLCRTLIEAIKENCKRGEKSILFLNRRGYATYVFCRSCGYIQKCPDCDVAMTYHQHTQTLVCHYCGRTMAPPAVCPGCKSEKIRFMGTGTEKIELALRELIPEARVLRMDYDTTRRQGEIGRMLAAFRGGEYDVLLGTQMVVKGLDFPDVTLVGILLADASLHFPDINAAQRTFQLITQACGRAGRGEKEGRVFMQTYTPNDPVLLLGAKQDFEGFYAYDIRHRSKRGYPPFARLLGIFVADENEENVLRDLQRIYRYLVRKYRNVRGMKVYRPAGAFVQKRKGKHIYHVLILYAQDDVLQKRLRQDLEMFCRELSTTVFAQVDPAALL